MMWEEHPKYQKRQVQLIGVLLLFLLAVAVVSFIATRDWDSLKQVFLFAGAFAIALGFVVGFAWMVVKIFTRKRAEASMIESNDKT